MFCPRSNFCPTQKTNRDSTDISEVKIIPEESKMISIAPLVNTWNVTPGMAVVKDIPEDIQKITLDKLLKNFEEDKLELDDVDNPLFEKSPDSDPDKQIFETMKYEINRLNSFSDKWPLQYINPKDLAETGFFYLQSDDQVQCAFCHVLIDDWNVGDQPLKEHMRKSPKCPFLMTTNVGNIPITPNKSIATPVKCLKMGQSLSYKPKHPRMADIRNRLMTYRSWPLIMLSSKQLSECGLYYTGVADVVTCFFCGGSLGNWELNDDPWVEHHKFFPHCGYLGLAKRHGRFPSDVKSSQTSNKVVSHEDVPHTEVVQNVSLRSSVANDVIHQACEVFPKSLVQEVVMKRMKSMQPPFTSLQEICEVVLEHKGKEGKKVTAEETPLKSQGPIYSNGSASVKDVLLCKICMDQERGVVFQPCGHLVSCPNCAQLIFNCPLCRAPITSKVRTFLS